jgi:hypothetical protein
MADGVRLAAGDRLVVLATVDGLQRVEQGTLRERGCTVLVERACSSDGAFEGAMAIARVTACQVEAARRTIEGLPATVPVSHYMQEGRRLVRELSRVQVEARLVPAQQLVQWEGV